jgi:serine/threonine-protein kinase RsbW
LTAEDQPSWRLQFDLHSDMQEVMQRVASVEAFAREAGCNQASAQQLALVAEEIFVNIVRNAWPGREPGHCTVDVVAVDQPERVHVTLRTDDDGIAFDPLQAEPTDLDATLDDRLIGGVGILLVKTMTDGQSYRRIDGRNIFEVTKACPHG